MLRTPRVEALFERAKKKIRQQIEHDAEQVSGAVAAVLEKMAEHLLEPLFNMEFLEQAGVLDRKTRRAFRAETGMSPKDYETRCKRDVAAFLLTETELEVRFVAEGLEYSQLGNFSRDFKRWTGESPTEFRARHRAHAEPEESWLASTATRIQATLGLLDAEQQAKFLAWLEGKLEVDDAESEAVSRGGGLIFFEGKVQGEDQAKMAWALLEGEALERQRELLRYGIRFGSRALFDLLSRKSREEGRGDRRRGVELAELALICVDGSAAVLGDAFPDLHALALARLGNALRLVGDYAESERAFARATAGEAPGPRIESEILDLEASLRIFQRRYDEALTLLTRSIELAETTGNLRQQVNSIIQRAVVISHRGQPQNAIPDLQRALQFLERLDEPELRLHVIHELARAHLEWGRHEVTMALLPEARSLANDLNLPVSRLQLDWIEGRARKARGDVEGAATLLDQARTGFLERGEVSYAAEIALELTILHHEAGRHAEVRTLVLDDVIPVFEHQRISREALAGRNLLRDALETQQLTLEVLAEVQEYLRALGRVVDQKGGPEGSDPRGK